MGLKRSMMHPVYDDVDFLIPDPPHPAPKQDDCGDRIKGQHKERKTDNPRLTPRPRPTDALQ